jgi:hypothetical protein
MGLPCKFMGKSYPHAKTARLPLLDVAPRFLFLARGLAETPQLFGIMP